MVEAGIRCRKEKKRRGLRKKREKGRQLRRLMGKSRWNRNERGKRIE